MSGPSAPPPRPGLRQAGEAFRHRNFALFWSGALMSNTGNWVQNVTVPYVLYRMTRSPAWVGVAAFCQFMPIMLMGPVAGTVADRFSRRRVLIVTQAGAAGIAFLLWVLFVLDLARPAVMVAAVAAVGVVMGVNIPSWQAFISELVPRDVLLNAITLNSVQFNAARAFGPALGGLVLGTLGPSWSFLINALSFVAVLGALALVRVAPVERAATDGRVWSQFADGLRYARRRRGIVLCIVLVCAVGFFGSPVFQLTPVFAEEVFEVGPGLYGVLTASLGIGAVLGAPFVSGWGGNVRRSRLAGIALVAYAGALVGFGVSPVFVVGVVTLALAGACYLAVVTTLMTSLQLLVDEQVRGRVIALYMMGFTGSYPVGSLVQGWLAAAVGAPPTVVGAGLVLLAVAVFVRARPGLLESLDASPYAAAAPAAQAAASAASAASASSSPTSPAARPPTTGPARTRPGAGTTGRGDQDDGPAHEPGTAARSSS